MTEDPRTPAGAAEIDISPHDSARELPGERGPRDEAPASEDSSSADQESTPQAGEEQAGEEEAGEEFGPLQAELDGLRERYLRLAADFENYRRRAETEMREAWSRAQADLVRRLLESLDDLERVNEAETKHTTPEILIEGVKLVARKLLRGLEEAGVEVVEPVGERFDPTTMEAIMLVPVDDEERDDQVGQVFQKGYVLKGHLIRPARVSVQKHD